MAAGGDGGGAAAAAAEADAEAPAALEASDCVVIAPGSRTLRVGFAATAEGGRAPAPAAMAHCVAYARAGGDQGAKSAAPEGGWSARAEARAGELRRAARVLMRSDAAVAPAEDELADEEALAPLRYVDPHAGTDEPPACIPGDDALRLPPSAAYDVVWPIRRGRLAVGGAAARSRARVLGALARVWEHALSRALGLSRAQRSTRAAVLVLPETLTAADARDLVDVCVRELGFARVCVHCEGACVCAAQGVSSGVVCSLGAGVSTVVCVEEGLASAARGARAEAHRGAEDAARVLAWQLRACGALPPRALLDPERAACDLEVASAALRRHGAFLEETLGPGRQRTRASLWLRARAGARTRTHARAREDAAGADANADAGAAAGAPELFEIELGEAPHVAPHALLGPGLSGEGCGAWEPAPPTRGHRAGVAGAAGAGVEASLAEALGRGRTLGSGRPSASDLAAMGEADASPGDAKRRRVSGGGGPSAARCDGGGVSDEAGEGEGVGESIARCVLAASANADAREKLLGSVLLVGGGANTEGAAREVEAAVREALAREGEGKLRQAAEVLPLTHPADEMAWRGGAVLAIVDSGGSYTSERGERGDAWVAREEWLARGVCVGGERRRYTDASRVGVYARMLAYAGSGSFRPLQPAEA